MGYTTPEARPYSTHRMVSPSHLHSGCAQPTKQSLTADSLSGSSDRIDSGAGKWSKTLRDLFLFFPLNGQQDACSSWPAPLPLIHAVKTVAFFTDLEQIKDTNPIAACSVYRSITNRLIALAPGRWNGFFPICILTMKNKEQSPSW